jgi:hypothetical protein
MLRVSDAWLSGRLQGRSGTQGQKEGGRRRASRCFNAKICQNSEQTTRTRVAKRTTRQTLTWSEIQSVTRHPRENATFNDDSSRRPYACDPASRARPLVSTSWLPSDGSIDRVSRTIEPSPLRVMWVKTQNHPSYRSTGRSPLALGHMRMLIHIGPLQAVCCAWKQPARRLMVVEC